MLVEERFQLFRPLIARQHVPLLSTIAGVPLTPNCTPSV
jgi:hypothetical protein